MSAQPEALRLADAWGNASNFTEDMAAGAEMAEELRRLHAENLELLEALKDLREAIKSRGVISTVKALKKTDAAIDKAEGVTA